MTFISLFRELNKEIEKQAREVKKEGIKSISIALVSFLKIHTFKENCLVHHKERQDRKDMK